MPRLTARGWAHLLRDRLGEPLHLNALAALVLAFGSTRAKIEFDLVQRRQHAYCLLRCAEHAAGWGISRLTAVEMGVASGGGLLNLAEVAAKVTRATGVEFDIVGFDTGGGMPPATDYRDHPDLYLHGDFPMDRTKLEAALPPNVRLVIGDVAATVPGFLDGLSPQAPIGFLSLDVDQYRSAKAALQVCADPDPEKYLPLTWVYVDDIDSERHNSACGELLAIEEFNHGHHPTRLIEVVSVLRQRRIFKRAAWIDHIYALHVLDHPHRATQILDIAPRTM